MFVNKFFISKQNGIKQNGTNKGLLIKVVLLILVGVLSSFAGRLSVIQAAEPQVVASDELKNYTEPFQNTTTTLSGDSVEANMYFIKMDYWDVKKLTINFNFQVSQLANKETSDITLSLNGTKFYSFRPKNQTGLQTQAIDVPLKLLQGQNQLKINGQILNKAEDRSYQVQQTPANWLTIYDGANANFEYQLQSPTSAINSFNAHFSGTDTIGTHNSAIILPKQATNAELTAGMYALAGESRTIAAGDNSLSITTKGSSAAKEATYQLVIGTYTHLASEFQEQLDRGRLDKQAVIKTYSHNNKHYLIVSSLNGKLLQKASRFIANQELMKETSATTKYIGENTQTFTSELHSGVNTQLTTQDDYLTGAKHQSRTYFVNLPVDRTNADGSEIRLHFRYAKNLDFKRSLATVYVNDKPLGSKRLSAAKADNDELTVKLPKGQALGHSFTIRIAFDLEINGQNNSDNAQTPWALVLASSQAEIHSQPVADLLLTNYPYLFLKNSTFNQIAVVRPKRLTGYDYQTLTNIFNLIGNYSQSNSGRIKFYEKQPSQSVLKNSNVIAFGTPRQNELIKNLNSKLYFQFDKQKQGFLSNEKLSIEKNYGQNIGTVQLLRSPYNQKAGLLVVTAAKSKDVYLASTQINNQRNIAQYQGDAIVVDHDNNHYGYRFKKHKSLDEKNSFKITVKKNSQLLLYLGIALLVGIVVLGTMLLVLRKNRSMERKR
ncbi:cellulose biosynthesis cyclic di-GMP-binding regulatory protein BcsB [Ligilactobacillus acidipiscis]|uniref:cellulose biosynthesis cyclic di-GMP-binding regulatory protein BcsB n=1 Tax=Ligilactobacillus acidipiscis TaxID=89059 RepID=UPI0023F7CF53|nr:cellulose biosynthesis cyclic di-GMP-binding regulatory protein BcsB [Ligilactobacillus acidipiscis]WEV56600.1 cellulose biosynthesis cyclic di-GMP-binding regulatory protein BcsB [Ligilactobacillus acidipiscis]